MNTPADARLQRVLDLEEKQGLRNRAVMGGLQAMAQRWSTDAASEGVDAATIAALTRLMQQYGSASTSERAELMATMRRILAGEMPPELATQPEPAPSDDVTEAAIEPPAIKPPVKPVAPPKPKPVVAKAPPKEEPALEIPAGDDTPAFDEIVATPAPAPVVERPVMGGPVSPGLGTVYSLPEDEYPPYDQEPAKGRQRKPAPGNVKRNPRDLQAPVTILPGVGEATAEQLERLGITKVVDLLWHLPTRYDDFSQLKTIDKLEPGEQATIIANLWDVRERKISMNRSMVEGILGDSTGTLHATWFNKWIMKQLHPGETLRFSGKIGLYRGQKTIESPAFEELDEERVATGRMSPVYGLTEGITNNRLRNLIHDVLEDYSRFLNDPLPAQMRHTYHLVDLASALHQIHFPDSPEQLLTARRRLAFEELLYIQLGVLQKRRSLHQSSAPALTIDDATMSAYTNTLPFPLTGAQERVIEEIRRDLDRTAPMTRLLQGDVGSGKTAVAAAAMWTSAANATQSAMLAPTQILAEQHHRGISRLLGQLTRPDGSPVNVALLTGRVTGEAREQVLDGLRSGEIDVVVGTTALIQEHVEFANLGLAVVDEQHRFGVEQRGVLRTKATGQPHLLVMSATPIPRSLALTLYGDLDLSVIDELPPGRTPIRTKLFAPGERERLYDFIRREIEKGRQAYVVYPLVEESEVLDAGAATVEQKRLQEEVFPAFSVALLHGRMTGNEKDEVMQAFAAGEYQILVSTTVIEVGIDVPNATVMVIEDADRFGLAQMHQLRGRVGRGEHPGYCALISKTDSQAVRERLLLLADEEHGRDGFWIAQKDLDMRGPGEFLGTRQSGLPEMKIASLSDMATLLEAREAAQIMFEQDPMLSQFPQISRQVDRFWRGHGDVN